MDPLESPNTTTNLEAIVGGRNDFENGVALDRTVTFAVTPEGLRVTEGCDDYFNATLTRDQVEALIAWLSERLHHMPAKGA